MKSFLFFDFETDGKGFASCRPVQFAAIRTDLALNPIGEPTMLFMRPPIDRLPSPHAIAVHKKAPWEQEAGLPEGAFARAIQALVEEPGTICVAHNGHSFDYKVLQHLLYRNILPPYDWMHSAGRSRFDTLPLLRGVHAFSPGAMPFAAREDGGVSYKLDLTAAANGIDASSAHDALADVETMISLFERARSAAPAVTKHYFSLRFKSNVDEVLQEAMFWLLLPTNPAAQKCASLYTRLGVTDRSEVVLWDLRVNPRVFIDVTPEELVLRQFSKDDALLEMGAVRPGLQPIRANQAPFVAPVDMAHSVLWDDAELNATDVDRNLAWLSDHQRLTESWVEAYQSRKNAFTAENEDVEEQLFGDLILGPDEGRLRRLRQRLARDGSLGEPVDVRKMHFDDGRLSEICFRFIARNYPHRLTAKGKQYWELFVSRRLQEDALRFLADLKEAREAHPEMSQTWDRVHEWAHAHMNEHNVSWP